MDTELTREEWGAALAMVSDQRLQGVADALPALWQVRPKVLPQAGLGMLKLRDSAFSDAFYLGEFPLASCQVSITTDEGVVAEGAALVMDDRVERAERLAICDALLAARLPGWEQVELLIQEGRAAQFQLARERKAMLARTRVDFSLLDDVGDDDA
jgi:alpha-D-ribose 1-methylphosphonate 5-triphosphate synthase subunit PhnG